MGPIASTGRRAIALRSSRLRESESPGDVEHFGPRDAFYPRFVGALLDELGVCFRESGRQLDGWRVVFTAAVTQPARIRS